MDPQKGTVPHLSKQLLRESFGCKALSVFRRFKHVERLSRDVAAMLGQASAASVLSHPVGAHFGCRWMKGLVFLLLGFWVPQIVHCARHDARQPLRPLYVVGTSLTRRAPSSHELSDPDQKPNTPR